jgi:hypothetical protein
MSEDNKIKSNENKTVCEQPVDLREETTGSLMEASFQLKCQFTRASSDFVRVKEELELELEKIEQKYRGKNDSFIFKKDQQIERMIRFYNKTEQIINNYEKLFQLLKIQNIILENAIHGKVMNDNNFAKEFLNLKY